MKTLLTLLTFGLLASTAAAAEPDTRLFEMRVYYAAEGKLDALNARFRDHTLKLFAKHDMTSLGYFVPTKNTENKLVYFLAYANREARDASWKAFQADPDWKAAAKASFDAFRADPAWVAAKEASEKKAGGSLTIKDGVKSEFLVPTDYSPVK